MGRGSAVDTAKGHPSRPRKGVKAHGLVIDHRGVTRRVDGGPRTEDIPVPRAVDPVWTHGFACDALSPFVRDPVEIAEAFIEPAVIMLEGAVVRVDRWVCRAAWAPVWRACRWDQRVCGNQRNAVSSSGAGAGRAHSKQK